jgi:hypothetical protein
MPIIILPSVFVPDKAGVRLVYHIKMF